MTDAPLTFDGEVAVVTGAGGGLGRSHAFAFAARGARVLVNDIDAAAAQAVAREIEAQGGTAIANADSVADGDEIVAAARDRFGKLSILVNNAGLIRDAAFHKMTDEAWDRVQEVHLRGAYKVTRAAWELMRDAGYGRIVMTSSAAGLYGNFGQASYAAAKMGLFGFAQTLAVEGRSRNINVNTIAPLAASPMAQTVMSEEMLAVLDPALVSPLLLWLCHRSCDETGQLYEVGGGWVARTRWQRSKGACLDRRGAVTAEDVRRAWSRVQDFGDAACPATMSDALAPVADLSGIDFRLQRRPRKS